APGWRHQSDCSRRHRLLSDIKGDVKPLPNSARLVHNGGNERRRAMGEKIRLTASDGFGLGAYRARPEGAARGGVVVIQEIWGVNSWVRSVADRFARHGFLAVAPQMFDRLQPDFESEDYGPDHFPKV